MLSRPDGPKGRLIVAIGSYTPEMREVPVELIRQATAVKVHTRRHLFHKHEDIVEGGVVIVDTLDGALKEAGELIEAGLEPRQLVEYVSLLSSPFIPCFVSSSCGSPAAATMRFWTDMAFAGLVSWRI